MKTFKKISSKFLICILVIQSVISPITTTASEVGSETILEMIDQDEINAGLGETDMIPAAASGSAIEVPTSVINNIIAMKGNQGLQDIPNYRPINGDKISLRFDFTLPSEHDYHDGYQLTYPLPEVLKNGIGSGGLAEEGVEYATYQVENDEVIITFNENVRAYGKGLEINGYFQIEAEFSLSGTDLEYDLVLPNQEETSGTITILLYFQPVGGTDINKSVSPATGTNTSRVEWTVDVNKEMDNLNLGKEFTDTLVGIIHMKQVL